LGITELSDQFLYHLLHRNFGNNSLFPSQYPFKKVSYCDGVRDPDLWILAAVTEMLAAHSLAPESVSLSRNTLEQFLKYVKTGSELVESRLESKDLQDFSGKRVKGLVFDVGSYIDHPENRFTGFTGNHFPGEVDINPAPVSWDISHATRFIYVFETLFRNRHVTGQTFPDRQVMEKMANQFIYGVFNKDFKRPLFTNFIDGSNGWYRVNYEGHDGTGTQPYGLSIVSMWGYGFWVQYNPHIRDVMNRLLEMFDSAYSVQDDSGNYHELDLSSRSNTRGKTVKGVRGNALQIAGPHGIIQTTVHYNESKMALSMWVKTMPEDKSSDDRALIMSNNNGFWVNQGHYSYLDSSVGARPSTVKAYEGNWVHLAVSRDVIGGTRFYVNGELVHQWHSNADYDLPLRIVAYYDGDIAGPAFDEIKVFSRSLNSHEIKAEYLKGSANDDLLAYWSFDKAIDEDALKHLQRYYGSSWSGGASGGIENRSHLGKTDSSLFMVFLSSFVHSN
jgi:hypothetical protein